MGVTFKTKPEYDIGIRRRFKAPEEEKLDVGLDEPVTRKEIEENPAVYGRGKAFDPAPEDTLLLKESNVDPKAFEIDELADSEDAILRKLLLSKLYIDPEEQKALYRDRYDWEKKENTKAWERLGGGMSEASAGLGTIYGKTPAPAFDGKGAADETEAQFGGMRGQREALREGGKFDPKVADYLMKIVSGRQQADLGRERMATQAELAAERLAQQEELARLRLGQQKELNQESMNLRRELGEGSLNLRRELGEGSLEQRKREAEARAAADAAKAAKMPDDKRAKSGEAGARADIINKNIDDLKNDVMSNKLDWKKMAASNYLGYPSGAEYEKFQGTLYDIALDYAKLVDPTSVAREGEVASAKKYAAPILKYLSMPDEGSKGEAIKILDQYKARVRDRMDAMERNQGLKFSNQPTGPAPGYPEGKPDGGGSSDSRIDSFMRKNNIQDRNKAIEILKRNGKL